MSDSDLNNSISHKLFLILLSKELFLLRSVIKLYAMLSHNLIFQIVSVDMPNVPFEELNGIDVVTMESKKNLKKIN